MSGAVEPFQKRVNDWILACFGQAIADDRIERNHRFLEEALELVQSIGCTQSEAHQLVDYVFGREIGDPPQEIGGVMNTLAALCNSSGFDMVSCGEIELSRVWTKVEKIRAKQAAKPKHSPLPQPTRAPTDAAIRAAVVELADSRSYALALEQELRDRADTPPVPRMSESDFDCLILDAMAEAMKAMKKFPQPNYVISKIAEEAGEVVKAAIHCAEGRETAENLRGEMVQLIAMLYRLWIEGDQVHGLPPVNKSVREVIGGAE